ncbi:hypothetical protein [uncultured Moraxella sp.]|uniref:hypothetical protein n=1 Tax=uncultured Moraxella sp. TaxID=263769 RepID=UPI0025F72D03|nr:hypothetical protein [uncultured Moraxella sp.]
MQGKILRDTANGDGIIFVDGVQKTFSLEKHWKSGEPPVIGAVVEVLLDDDGDVKSVTLVDNVDVAKQKADQAFATATQNGKNFLNVATSGMSKPVMGCIAALIVSAFVFKFFSVTIPYGGTHGAPFMALGGFYGFLFIVAVLAPFGKNFIQDTKGWFLYFIPLAYILLISIMIKSGVADFAAQTKQLSQLMGQFGMRGFELKISYGFGFYISVLLSGYIAFVGFKNFKAQK